MPLTILRSKPSKATNHNTSNPPPINTTPALLSKEPPRVHMKDKIKMRWLKAINTRLTKDKITATKIKRDEPTTRLIKKTWEPILKQYLDLPNDWLHYREVLVGRNP